MESAALLFAFQKSTVFEKLTKHRETVAEGNVFETPSSGSALDKASRWLEPRDVGGPDHEEPT
jgi:hypothetical protein